MQKLQTPSEEHTQFDAICERVGEWDTLPAVHATRPEHEHEATQTQQVASLNGLILAGLVSP